MNSLQAHGIQKACGIADDQTSVEVILWLSPVSSFGNRLCPVSMQRPAFQQRPDHGMRFEFLKKLVRIDARVGIIESDDKADRDIAIGHVVNKSAAEFFV